MPNINGFQEPQAEYLFYLSTQQQTFNIVSSGYLE